jgi:hypothetical protein
MVPRGTSRNRVLDIRHDALSVATPDLTIELLVECR